MTTITFTSKQKDIPLQIINNMPDGVKYILSQEQPRTGAQNSRYWATLRDRLSEIAQGIAELSDETGYTPREIRRLIGERLLPEQSAFLYATTESAAHDVLKAICGVPTSTRLGTKKFQAFEEIMEASASEIAGIIGAVIDEMKRMAA